MTVAVTIPSGTPSGIKESTIWAQMELAPGVTAWLYDEGPTDGRLLASVEAVVDRFLNRTRVGEAQ